MHLISVVLADDDRLILDDLKTIVDWHALGFEIKAVAFNGKQALDYVEQYRPQLLITDIIMPTLNGLDLTKKVREKYPNIQILLISSYDEFAYVKQAIQFGVYDYILKTEITPVTFSQKLSALYKTCKTRQQTNTNALRQELHRYFSDTSSADLSESLYPDIWNIKQQSYHFIFFSLSVTFVIDADSQYDEWLQSSEYILQLLEQVQGNGSEIPILFTCRHFVIAGFRIESSQHNRIYAINATGRRLYHAINSRSKRVCAQFFHPSRLTLMAFKKVYSEYLPLLEFYSLFPEDHPVDLSTLTPSSCTLTNRSFRFQELSRSPEHLEENILHIKEYLTSLYQNKDAASIQQFLRNFVHYADYSTTEQNTAEGQMYFPSFEHFLKWTFNTMEHMMSERSAQGKSACSTPVAAAISYMEANYSEHTLTAEDIASHVGLSSGRLGVIFKEDTCQTINEYLTGIRISNSIYMLEHTYMKIYEISEKCGYKSSQYFSQIFFQRTGKRPNEVRKARSDNSH